MAEPIKLAVLAMGGEGGGVLSDWIVDLAEHNGYIAQSTSVPGVAQRTGATIYYIELFEQSRAAQAGAAPVLALMPLPGDVDVVLASELMEAARAVQRGLVTPARTTLLASTHRVYAIAEKIALGDGRVDSAKLLAEVQSAAKRFEGFDMAAAATAHSSVISAVLLGALAGSGVLPFAREQFEATIRRGGVDALGSLNAFAAGFDRVQVPEQAALPPIPEAAAHAPRATHPEVLALLAQAHADYRDSVLELVVEGLRRLVDYQDTAYATLYLQRLAHVRLRERNVAPMSSQLTAEVARHLALWMSYEDTIRVADLKTRNSRFERVRLEVGATPTQVLGIHEYMHPRLQEIADTLPAALGRWLLRNGLARRCVTRLAVRGRVVHTSSLRGFLLLSGVAALRRWRRSTLRYVTEQQRIEAWLQDIDQTAPVKLELAIEIARCQRLIKGYGDTHERGLRSYESLRALWTRRTPCLTPAALEELRDAALADEHGTALRAALQRHAAVPESGV